MSEDQETQKDQSEQPEEKKPERTFLLLNVVRRRHTKMKRRLTPGRQRFKQYVGDLRLCRNRPRAVGETFIHKNLRQIKEMEKAGIIEVHNRSGQLVDLNTMKAEPPPPPKPQPNPPVDSAANDRPAGSPVPHFEGGKGVDEKAQAPSLASAEIPEGIDPNKESEEIEGTTEETETSAQEESESSTEDASGGEEDPTSIPEVEVTSTQTSASRNRKKSARKKRGAKR